MKPIWIAVLEDKHFDIVVEVYEERSDAMEAAERMAEQYYGRYDKDDIDVEPRPELEYYFSVEDGPTIYVRETVICGPGEQAP